MEDSSRPFNSDAFEPGSECIKLLYNKPSKTLVAQFRRIDERAFPKEELYLRPSDEREYKKIDIPDTRVSCWDPLSCGRKPLVVFNAIRLNGSAGGDWVSISQVDLPTGNVKKLIDSGTLKLPSGFTRGWIASLLDVDDEGRTIVCRLALEADHGDITKVQYFVSEVDVVTGDISNLASLPNVFV